MRPGTKLLAVVKANAYGLGAREAARVFVSGGADMLGVATPEEGIFLREAGIEAPILVFVPLMPEDAWTAARFALTATVVDKEGAMALAKAADCAGLRVRVHLKVDTGLGRLGVLPAQAVYVAEEVFKLPGLYLEGVYTHLADAGFRDRLTRRQFDRLVSVREALREAGFEVPLYHVCNSAATVRFPDMHLDMVRVGTLLYGQYVGKRGNFTLELKNPVKVKARIVQVKQLPAGSTVGYGTQHRLKRESRVAVIPVGYADGLGIVPQPRPRSFADLWRWLAKLVLGWLGLRQEAQVVSPEGRKIPVLGRIGMQLSVVDVSRFPHLDKGDEIEIKMRRLLISPLFPRVYLRDGGTWSTEGGLRQPNGNAE